MGRWSLPKASEAAEDEGEEVGPVGARKDDTWGAPLVLVVEPDREVRELLRRWLAGTGAEVLFCPGPRAPRYRCVGGQGGPCPLAEAADVVVLDLDLDSEVAGEGTACEELVSYYTGLGTPVVAFGPYAQVVRPYAESGVRAIGWPVRREELIKAVIDAYEGTRVVRSGPKVPEAPEGSTGPVPVEAGLEGMVVARGTGWRPVTRRERRNSTLRRRTFTLVR